MDTGTGDKQGLALLQTDLAGIGSRGVTGVLRLCPSMRMIAVTLYRVSQSLGARSPLLGALAKQLNHFITGADIAWQAQAGPGLQLQHPTGVVIGPHVTIGSYVAIEQGVTLGATDGTRQAESSPTIGRDVMVGAGARVLGGITVGDGARVGANAVVLTNVPPGASAVGVPARILAAKRHESRQQ